MDNTRIRILLKKSNAYNVKNLFMPSNLFSKVVGVDQNIEKEKWVTKKVYLVSSSLKPPLL